MNCKQTEEILPLYAGGDLDEKRAASVTAHLEGCPACAQVAAEYRATFKMTQQFSPLVFSEDLFANLHRNVLNEIEAQAARPSLSDFFFEWLRPRTTWAVASAMVVAFAVLAIYFVASRRGGNAPVAKNPEAVRQSTARGTAGQKASSIASTASSENSGTGTPRAPKPKKWRSGRSSGLIANRHESPSLNISPNQSESADANPVPVNDSTEERPLRVEIQTKDPNIRIIWFSQSTPKPALPNSKGI